MAETITETIVPGTYIEVRPEGLIGVGGIIIGNIGIVGTASKGLKKKPITLSSYTEAVEVFGEYDAWVDGTKNELTLVRALEQIYKNNGTATVVAVRVVSAAAETASYDLTSASDTCAKLFAKSPGTWGNGIKINIFDATDDVFVSKKKHKCNGSPIKLERGDIKKSSRNLITVKNDATGEAKIFDVVYTNDILISEKVKIKESSGELKFYKGRAGGDETPKEGHTLYASYVIDKSYCVKVKIVYNNITEEYNVPDGKYLVQSINASSKLIYAEEGTESDEQPTNFEGNDDKQFGIDGKMSRNNGEDAGANEYAEGLRELKEQTVHIVLAAGLSFDDIQSELVAHCETTENLNRERIALVGGGVDEDGRPDNIDKILGYADKITDDRVILVAPGIKSKDSASPEKKEHVTLPGSYAAAAVAGRISSLAVHISPTNKTLTLNGLENGYSYGKLKKLVEKWVLVIQEKNGYRIVRGVTTEGGPFKQITTRRIVDYAKEGIRKGSQHYIGRLNNSRVRAALRATLDSFLSRMVVDEQLTEYTLSVSATRPEEIEGVCRVEATLKPTFSIDSIKVIMTLQ